jgi:tetratricopeptide (TPR) repeat protein
VLFQRTRDIRDIRQALTYAEKAAITSPRNTSVILWLSMTLAASYAETGEIAHIDRAIRLAERALRAAPFEDRAADLHNLARLYGLRYDRIGEDSDLRRCIACHEKAFSLVSPDSEADWMYAAAANYSRVLNTAFLRIRDVAYSDRCVAGLEAALRRLPPTHPDRSLVLGNIGTCLLTRLEFYAEETSLAALTRIVDVFQEAADALPPDHSHKPIIARSGRLR